MANITTDDDTTGGHDLPISYWFLMAIIQRTHKTYMQEHPVDESFVKLPPSLLLKTSQ